MEGLEKISFEILSAVGTAKSLFIEAIFAAKENDFKKAQEKIVTGDTHLITGHKVHAELLQREAQGEKIEFSLLLMHVEDQFMSAEIFKILSQEFVDLYQSILEK